MRAPFEVQAPQVAMMLEVAAAGGAHLCVGKHKTCFRTLSNAVDFNRLLGAYMRCALLVNDITCTALQHPVCACCKTKRTSPPNTYRKSVPPVR